MIRSILYIAFVVCGMSLSFAQVKTEEILLNNAVIQLPGTLTYSENKAPLIIWVHGSGPVNRNGNQPMYIQQFREAINKNGIAFFSYDKRTANPKNASFLSDIQIYDFVSDVETVVDHFKNDERFSKIILIGHSQGSLIAMLALDDVDKYISIAGAGVPIDKTIVRQVTKQNPIFGALTKTYFKELKETGAIKEVDPNLLSIFAKPNQLFLSTWIELDPTEEIKKVNIPALIINGNKDFQVEIADAEALKKANPNSELKIIKNMNHVLKTIQKEEDNMKSYISPDYPLSEELIQTIVKFVKK